MTAAEKHIRHYNHLNGKAITRHQLERIHTSLKKDIDAKRIDTHAPLGAECLDIEKRMIQALPHLNGKPKRVTLQVIDVDKILRTHKAPVLPATVKKPVLNGKTVATSKPVVKPSPSNGLKHKIDLSDGPYRDFVKLYIDTQVMYFGLPGAGKTWDLMTFMKYLADKGYPVVYVAAEEYGRSTFDEKIQGIFRQPSLKEFKYPNLRFVKSLNEIQSFENVKVLLLDSVDKVKWSVEDWTAFSDAHPNMIKIAVKQTTKDGDFKGGQEWAHEMDIVTEIRNKKRIFHKNRLDPSFAEKRDNLLLEDKIRKREEKLHIQQTIKQRMTPMGEDAILNFKPDTVV